MLSLDIFTPLLFTKLIENRDFVGGGGGGGGAFTKKTLNDRQLRRVYSKITLVLY